MAKKSETTRLKNSSFKRSACPVACALDIIGDKWTLLIIRDLIKGKHRYNEFLESKEAITTNILANRLQRLEEAGLIFKSPYQNNPVRYEYFLTDTGNTLRPVVRSIVEWANSQIPGTQKPQLQKLSHIPSK